MRICSNTPVASPRTINGESYNNLGEQLFGIVTREPIGVVGLITPWNFPFLILL